MFLLDKDKDYIYISILLVTKNQNVRTSYLKRAHVLDKTSVRFK